MPRPYTIARLAAAAEVHVETIRYYQRLKLVPEPLRPLGGIRRYTEADADRLRFIKRAQAMGFTLAEIVSLLILRTRAARAGRRESSPRSSWASSTPASANCAICATTLQA